MKDKHIIWAAVVLLIAFWGSPNLLSALTYMLTGGVAL